MEITSGQMESLLPLLPDTKDLRHYPYSVTVPMLQEAFAKLAERNAQD